MLDPHDPSVTQQGESVATHATAIGYEVRDTNIAAIVTFIVGLFLALALTQVGMWLLLKGIAREKPTSALELSPREAILRQRDGLNAREDASLNGYGWADPKQEPGAVRIPIDRAIEVLSERGLPPMADKPRSEVEVNSHSGIPAPEPKGAAGKEARP